MCIAFFFVFFSVNMVFFPIHFSGLLGIPRKIVDYPDCFFVYNNLSRIGSFFSIFSVFFFIYVIMDSLVSGFFCVDDFFVDGGSVFNLGVNMSFSHSYCQGVFYVVY